MNGCLATDCMHDGMHTHARNPMVRTSIERCHIRCMHVFVLSSMSVAHICTALERVYNWANECVQGRTKAKGWWNEKAIAKSVCACVCVCVANAQPLSCLSYSNIYEKRGKEIIWTIKSIWTLLLERTHKPSRNISFGLVNFVFIYISSLIYKYFRFVSLFFIQFNGAFINHHIDGRGTCRPPTTNSFVILFYFLLRNFLNVVNDL